VPKLSVKTLRTRINQLEKQLAAVEAEKKPAIRKVQALMKKLGITLSDLSRSAGKTRRGRPAKEAKSDKLKLNGARARKSLGKIAVKYRDGSGNAWTGRGKTPRWIVEAEKTGRSRESFLVV